MAPEPHGLPVYMTAHQADAVEMVPQCLEKGLHPPLSIVKDSAIQGDVQGKGCYPPIPLFRGTQQRCSLGQPRPGHYGKPQALPGQGASGQALHHNEQIPVAFLSSLAPGPGAEEHHRVQALAQVPAKVFDQGLQVLSVHIALPQRFSHRDAGNTEGLIPCALRVSVRFLPSAFPQQGREKVIRLLVFLFGEPTDSERL